MSGFPIKEARLLLDKIQNLEEDDFKRYQENKKVEIVKYHLANTPFYQELCNKTAYSKWEELPIMTKENLQQPLENRLSNSYKKNDVYINKTSGSSGNPFVFAKDKFCHAMTWSIIQHRFGLFGIDFNKSLQARFYGIPLDKKGYYKERLKDVISNRYRFSVFDLSEKALNNYLLKFKTTKFNYINGYTSSVVQFAKFLERKNLILTTICPTLKACVVTSEMLFDQDKELMERQFNVPVINEYGASELDLIAFQNKENKWILNNETLVVEIVDDNGKVLSNGKEGRVVITSLYNKAHPFIRYDIGDIGIISSKSTFKNPLLEKLIGRTNDIAVLPSGKKAAGLTFYYITKSIVEDDGNVSEFVIEQLDLKTFKILYVSTTPLTSLQIHHITAEMENYLEKGLDIIFERTEKLARSASGKLKQFSSLLN